MITIHHLGVSQSYRIVWRLPDLRRVRPQVYLMAEQM
jgi:hypothetical protein